MGGRTKSIQTTITKNSDMTLGVILWIVIAMGFYFCGEIFAKWFANSPSPKNAILAMLFYTLNTACFLPALTKFNSLSILGTIWSVCYVIITITIGVFIFHEPLTTIKIIGLIFGLISIILLSL